ncbi:MAG: modification methylase hemK [Glaciihabitans sp.]|nr:modification methylase hemK [Glaciihabitans sp.]
MADLPLLVARLRAAGCVFAEDEAQLILTAATSDGDVERMVRLRIEGEPLEYILGWAEFAGMRILVDPGVFVPRRRTEFLVGQAVRLSSATAVVVDLCCGSGALGAALLAAVPDAVVYAADVDPAAVATARRNLAPERVFEGDLFDALPTGLRGRVDILMCNTPYVPTAQIALMPPEAREHEHRVALDGGEDGLDLQRRVAAEAAQWLAPGGRLLVEASEDQAPVTAELFAAGGLSPSILTSAEYYATIVIGTRP